MYIQCLLLNGIFRLGVRISFKFIYSVWGTKNAFHSENRSETRISSLVHVLDEGYVHVSL